jgi:hypothetical protein
MKDIEQTESFEELDNLAEGIKDLGDLSLEQMRSNPQHKKFKEALGGLSKEQRKQYMEKTHNRSFEERKEEEKKNKIIPPNTERLSFLLDDKFFNKPKNQDARELVKSRHQEEMKDHVKEKVDKWVDNIEMVNIDLSSVHDLSYAPKNYADSAYGTGSFYKDGVLLRFNNKKNNSTFHVVLNTLTETADKTEFLLEEDMNFRTFDVGCFMVQEHGILQHNFAHDTLYHFSDWKNWTKECFNNYNFPIYIMFENFSKTRVVKINLKDNIHINHVKNIFLKNNKCTEKNIFEYEFPKGMPFDNYKKNLYAKGACLTALYHKRISSEGTFEDTMKQNISSAGLKKGILMGSWATALDFCITRIVTVLRDYNELSKKELIHIKKIVTSEKGKTKDGQPYIRSSLINNKALQNFLIDAYDLAIDCKENNSNYFILKKVRDFIEKHKRLKVTDKKNIKQFSEMRDVHMITRYYLKNNADFNTLASKALTVDGKLHKRLCTRTRGLNEAFNSIFLYITLFYNTNNGLRLPNGQAIDFENFTESDCAIYWTHTPQLLLLEYFTGISVSNRAPLLIENGKVMNDISINHENLSKFQVIDKCNPPLPHPGRIYKGKELKPILNEAFDNEIYNFVWGSGSELEDNIFKYLKFFELDDHIVIFACDKRNRYLAETLRKKTRSFTGLFFNETNHPDTVEEATKSIYIKFATLIRDVKVIVDRVANLSYQGRRQPRDLEIPLDEPMEIITPRSRYPRRRKINGSRNGLGISTNVYKTAGFRRKK